MVSSLSGLSPVQRIQFAVMTYATRPTANSTASIIIWLLGALSTRTFFNELGITNANNPLISSLAAIVAQAVLTLLEGPVWHSILRTELIRTIFGVGALAVDTAFNVGGIWYFLQNLGNTTFWRAIASASGQIQADGSAVAPASLTILLLSILFGLAVSAAPEALWDL